MRLKSLTLKGFKSFPDRTTLDFGPGVSVVVGPNGSGKSNVTDAVLWAMGEQSPLAVRGQSMQDVIFGGGHGVQARSAAEVEIVLDNSDGAVDLPVSEISIARRLDRSGEGGYRLNGARCRLTDVIEVLSDTGLGKETHSVISQGRVESIVTSKPRDRRLLIEEAAGLGKHRKRRRRAQLKLERTQENLDRALDVEREARTRLRPLKRQAEAAELHERLERQTLEARWTLAREALRVRGAQLRTAESRVRDARKRREEVEAGLQAVVSRRGEAERALTERSERHDALARRAYDARSARDRVGMRCEQAGVSAQALARRIERLQAEIAEPLATPSAPALARSREEATEGASPIVSATGDSPAGQEGQTSSWERAWEQVRNAIADGVRRALAQTDGAARARVLDEALAEAEGLARGAAERAVAQALATGDAAGELRRAELAAAELSERTRRIERLRARLAADLALAPVAERLRTALDRLGEAIETGVVLRSQGELEQDSAAGEDLAGELRACAREEAEIQTALRACSEAVTEAEVAAQRLRDQAMEAESELRSIAERLQRPLPDDEGAPEQPLAAEEAEALAARVQRLERRREQLGPVNPLAQEEYAQALAHVEELESRRADLETALRELKTVIRDTDRQISETFERTFAAAAQNFEELVGDLFPGGTGRLRLVRDEQAPRAVLGGQPLGDAGTRAAGEAAADAGEAAADAEAERDELEREGEESPLGVEIEITPAGKSTKRLSLLSGGEKSMTALAFLFAVFLARPCPFYILDEVEAALDDLNLDRFLRLLRRYADRAQFIVITHQKRTMEAADWLYGVSMGTDGVSKVLSRRLPPEAAGREEAPQQAVRASSSVAGLGSGGPAEPVTAVAEVEPVEPVGPATPVAEVA
ncbi:MAG TPA: AAA family ATPase [Solirubrobacteraceae bacterium]|nr:AAA family ATPase [Solirubrobacteraceae bacterium]